MPHHKIGKYLLIGGAAVFALDYLLGFYADHASAGVNSTGSTVQASNNGQLYPSWYVGVANALEVTPIFSIPVWSMVAGGGLMLLHKVKI